MKKVAYCACKTVCQGELPGFKNPAAGVNWKPANDLYQTYLAEDMISKNERKTDMTEKKFIRSRISSIGF